MLDYIPGKRRVASATVRSTANNLLDESSSSKIYIGRPSSAPVPRSSAPNSPIKSKRYEPSNVNLSIEGKSVCILIFILFCYCNACRIMIWFVGIILQDKKTSNKSLL